MKRSNRLTNYIAILGLTTALVGLNYWSGKHANNAYSKGLSDKQVLQNANNQCVMRFGLQHESICSSISRPGVWLVYTARKIENELSKESEDMTFLSQYFN